jgi:hypothetical protein
MKNQYFSIKKLTARAAFCALLLMVSIGTDSLANTIVSFVKKTTNSVNQVDKKITGTIIAIDKQPLSGVSILIKTHG